LRYEDLLCYDAIVCDLDGVIYRGRRVIEENVSVLRELQGMGKVIRFLTNNSTRTPERYVERLRRVGFSVSPQDVMTSGMATAIYLQERGFERAYAVGSPALREVLRRRGIKVSAVEPEVVVVGMDPNFNYAKLRRAASFVFAGRPFVATNPDTSLPVEDGVLPGAGAMVAAISAASGRDPDVVVGKPNPIIFRMVARDLEGGRILFVGDRLNTDIAGGNAVGWDTLLVLTGVHTLGDVETLGIEPTYWVENLTLSKR